MHSGPYFLHSSHAQQQPLEPPINDLINKAFSYDKSLRENSLRHSQCGRMRMRVVRAYADTRMRLSISYALAAHVSAFSGLAMLSQSATALHTKYS